MKLGEPYLDEHHSSFSLPTVSVLWRCSGSCREGRRPARVAPYGSTARGGPGMWRHTGQPQGVAQGCGTIRVNRKGWPGDVAPYGSTARGGPGMWHHTGQPPGVAQACGAIRVNRQGWPRDVAPYGATARGGPGMWRHTGQPQGVARGRGVQPADTKDQNKRVKKERRG